MINQSNTALLLIDIQNDFVPGGALETKAGDKIIPVVNQLIQKFDQVLATQDWHPLQHKSFAVNHYPEHKIGEVIDLNGLEQILWPVHCVQGSWGASFATGLQTHQIEKVFQKGVDIEIDSYSGFYDNGKRRSTGLGEYLASKGVTTVYIAGLATDYCVKFSVLDALNLGLETFVVQDACSGVDLNRGDIENAIEAMKKAGAKIVRSTEI